MMRTAAWTWVAGMLAVGGALALAPAASADPGERINSYDISVTVTSSGNAHVTETIAYDFGTGQRHGITRTLPGRTLSGQATVSSPDGAPTTATTTGDTIRVGDPNTTVTGAHTYVLTYDVLGSLTPQSYAAAMVWNVLDGSWNVPIATMTETITAPATATLSSCWVSTSRCDSDAVTVDGNVIRFHQRNITPHQTVTVTATLPSTGLTLSTPSAASVPYSYYPTTASNEASSSKSSSSSSSAVGWVLGLGVVVLIVVGLAKAAGGGGSGRSRGSNTYYDNGSNTYYSSYSSSDSSSSSSSYSDSGSSSSSSSDSGSSSSSSDSGSW